MKKFYFILFISLAGLFSTCKKYPEGPAISFHSKSERITGTYEVSLYKVNDIDSTSFFHSKPAVGSCYKKYGFYSEHDIGQEISGGCCHGKWELKNQKKYINIAIAWGDSPFVVSNNDALLWKILRLSSKEFWLETDYFGNHYLVHLSKTQDIRP